MTASDSTMAPDAMSDEHEHVEGDDACHPGWESVRNPSRHPSQRGRETIAPAQLSFERDPSRRYRSWGVDSSLPESSSRAPVEVRVAFSLAWVVQCSPCHRFEIVSRVVPEKGQMGRLERWVGELPDRQSYPCSSPPLWQLCIPLGGYLT